MPSLSIHLDGDGCWPDMNDKGVIRPDKDIEVALLKGGMQSGKSSVAVRVDLPDGRIVFAETSLALFLAAADAFRVRDSMNDEPELSMKPSPPVGRASRVAPVEGNLTTDRNASGVGVPTSSGMNEKYVVLSEEERAKGFVRPVRRSYRHVGIPGPKYMLLDLTEEQHARYDDVGYVKFEQYPEGAEGRALGRYWTQEQLANIGKGCGTVTTMSQAIAETYAREPGFYGSTFCCGCGTHLRVGKDGEFVWEGTNERVGT